MYKTQTPNILLKKAQFLSYKPKGPPIQKEISFINLDHFLIGITLNYVCYL